MTSLYSAISVLDLLTKINIPEQEIYHVANVYNVYNVIITVFKNSDIRNTSHFFVLMRPYIANK